MTEQYDTEYIYTTKNDRRKEKLRQRGTYAIVGIIFTLCILLLLGKMEENDLRLKNQQLLEDNYSMKQPHLATCRYDQPNGEVTFFVDCKVIDQQYAKVN